MLRKMIIPAILILVSGSFVNAKDLPKLRVGYVAEPAHGLYYVAKDKGYFKEEGVDVELFQFGSAAEGVTALNAQKLDVGTFGTTAPLVYLTKGADFTFFGGMMIGGQALVVKPERLKEFKGKPASVYKGKKIGLVKLSTGDVVFKRALTKSKIDWKKDVTFVELGSAGAVTEAVNKGLVDAGLLWPPHFSLAEKNYGLKVSHYIEEWYPKYTCCRIISFTKTFNENKDTLRKFLISLIRGYHFYKTQPDETVKIYASNLKIDEDIVRRETYVNKVAESNPDPLKKKILEFWDGIVEANYVPKDLKVDVAGHINTEVYKSALDEVIKRYPNDKIYKEMLATYQKNN
jgi:NitT/TauT family transport system substrate-binding protein